MAGARRIGILTGGGDVPGLNSVIKSVVYQTTDMGYRGPGHSPRLGRTDAPRQVASASIPSTFSRSTAPTRSAIDRTGGTILHTSRTNPSKVKRSSLPKQRLPRKR